MIISLLRYGCHLYFDVHTVDQVESPYSPPDSDGTPLGSPSEQRLSSRTADCSLVLPAGKGHNQTPNNHLKESEYVTKPSSASPIRLVCNECLDLHGISKCCVEITNPVKKSSMTVQSVN